MRKNNRMPKEGTIKNCVECGKVFQMEHGSQVACEACKIHRINRLQREKRQGIYSIPQTIPCAKCGEQFTKRTSRQKTCDTCMAKRMIGVGSGNWQINAEDNGTFKHGKYAFSWRFLAHLGQENWFCNRCNADLRSVAKTKEGHGKWAVHHKDEDRKNQRFDNLELLCVTCHNNHHKHWEHNWVSQGRPKPNKG